MRFYRASANTCRRLSSAATRRSESILFKRSWDYRPKTRLRSMWTEIRYGCKVNYSPCICVCLLMEFCFVFFFIIRMAPPPRPICNCIARPDLTHGWEGTAIIGHGTLLRFGCLAYVFSIAEFERLDEDWKFVIFSFSMRKKDVVKV